MSHQYFYSENGQAKGPFTAQQLKEFARAGTIQPETLVWKEGTPQWAPASSYKGLLPPRPANGIREGEAPRTAAMDQAPVTARMDPAARPFSLPDVGGEPAAAGNGRLWLVLGGIGAALVALVVLVVVLLNSGKGEKEPRKEPDKVAKGNPKGEDKDLDPEEEPPDEKAPAQPAVNGSKDKPVAPRKEKPVAEMTAPALLEKYRADPQQTLKEFEGKRVILQIEARWDVEDLKKAINPKGDLELSFRTTRNGLGGYTPHNVIFLTFPDVNPTSKLGFFAKIKEYAEKWKKGQNVAIRVAGTVSTSPAPNLEFQAGTYLHLRDAELR